MILAIRTDGMDATIMLLDTNAHIIADHTWPAGRELAKDLLKLIDGLIEGKWKELSGIIVFRGPGSFTSLRIGITTANTIAYAQNIPIVGVENALWLQDGSDLLSSGENDTQVLPLYGSDPHITAPKK